MFRITISQAVSIQRCISKYPAIAVCSYNHSVQLNQKRNFTQGFFQALSESKPVAILQDATINLHDMTGMPWWATIMVSTFLLRGLITFPLSLYQQKILAKVEKVSTEDFPEIVKELKMETAYAQRKFEWTDQMAQNMYAKSLKKQWQNLLIRDNCHPAKSFIIIFFQIPLWITQSATLRNMLYMLPDPEDIKAQIVTAEMSLGGFGWIPNLIEIDHSFILPVSLGILNLTILEVTMHFKTFKFYSFFFFQIQIMSRKVKRDSKLAKYGTYFFRAFSVALVPIAAFTPSGLTLYWVSSSLFGLFQNFMIMSPKVRRLARIPKVASEHEKPYLNLYNEARKRLGK